MPAQHFLKQLLHHAGLERILLLLLLLEDRAKKICCGNLLTSLLDIGGNQTTLRRWDGDMAQTNARPRRQDRFEMYNSPGTDARIRADDRVLKDHYPGSNIAIPPDLASY